MRYNCFSIFNFSFISFMTIGMWFNSYDPQFSILCNWDNDRTPLIGLVQRIKWDDAFKCSTQCVRHLAHVLGAQYDLVALLSLLLFDFEFKRKK